MNEVLKKFDIDIENIPVNDDLFDNIQKAIDELRENQVYGNLEVILNNNLINAKDKLNNYRTILGCRVSYEDLERNISFIVKEDSEPTYEQLQNNWNELKEYCLNEQIPEEYDEYNSYIEFSNSVYENILNKMQELEQRKDENNK